MLIDKLNWKFHDGSTTGRGFTLKCNKSDTITIFITGNTEGRTIYFEGSDAEGNFYSAPAFKLPTYTLASSTTGNNEVWEISGINWHSISCRLGDNLPSGTVKITGKVVNTYA